MAALFPLLTAILTLVTEAIKWGSSISEKAELQARLNVMAQGFQKLNASKTPEDKQSAAKAISDALHSVA